MADAQPPFKQLSGEEFDRLSMDERLDYINRAFAHLRKELEAMRQAKLKKLPEG